MTGTWAEITIRVEPAFSGPSQPPHHRHKPSTLVLELDPGESHGLPDRDVAAHPSVDLPSRSFGRPADPLESTQQTVVRVKDQPQPPYKWFARSRRSRS